jgi:glycosyltransferase involved in cell wall biosynthesis
MAEPRFLMNRVQNHKLAIVIPSAYLSGGVQTWLDYVVPGLVARGWSVTVMPVHGHLHNAEKYLELHPFDKVRLVANSTGSREGRVRALSHALESTQPDLVLSVNIVDVYEAVARLRKRGLEGMRVAMALHGFNGAFFRDMKIYNQILDGVITTNRLGVAAAAEIGGIDGSRIHYAPCGVEVGNLDAGKLPEGTLNLLYAGRFDQREKHVLDLPGILAELDQRKVPFRLRLAGSGPDETELRSALSCFGERVEFLGQLDEQTLRNDFYKPGAILLITSPSESGPLVAWEAMSCGTVVVTSRYLGIGLEDSLRDGENCFVFPVSDTAAAADAIAKLQDTELLSRMVHEGHELVGRKYGREVSINAWNRALQMVLEQPSQVSVESPVTSMPAGRLDRWFGVTLAETMRSALGLKFRHGEPGGEWPHSYSGPDDQVFLDRLRALDQAELSAGIFK